MRERDAVLRRLCSTTTASPEKTEFAVETGRISTPRASSLKDGEFQKPLSVVGVPLWWRHEIRSESWTVVAGDR